MSSARVAALVGWFGVLAFLFGSIVTGLAYIGSRGEPYSPFNHYVSELGERANSELNLVFNSCLVLGALSLIVFFLVVAQRLGGWRGGVVGVLGVLAGVGGVLVGLIPMDIKGTHTIVAMVYFVSLAAAAILTTLWTGGRQLPHTRAVTVLGILTAAASAGYFAIFLATPSLPEGVDYRLTRPIVALDATVEWLALAAVMTWVASMGWELWRIANAEEKRALHETAAEAA